MRERIDLDDSSCSCRPVSDELVQEIKSENKYRKYGTVMLLCESLMSAVSNRLGCYFFLCTGED